MSFFGCNVQTGEWVACSSAVQVRRLSRVQRPAWRQRFCRRDPPHLGSVLRSLAVTGAATYTLRRANRLTHRLPSYGTGVVTLAACPDSLCDDADVSSDISTLGRWCAFYINLARRPDRRERLLRVLSRANPVLLQKLQRMEAVDGKRLSFKDRRLRSVVQDDALTKSRRAKAFGAYTIIHNGRGGMVHFDDHLTSGGIACAMSHWRALQAVASHPTADWGIILEDDVNYAVPNVEIAIAHILKQLPHDWDAVYLGYADSRSQMHSSALGDPAEDDESVDVSVGVELAPFVGLDVEEVLHCLPGLYAWMVRKEAASAILKNVFPIKGQVDLAISKWLVNERGRAYCVPRTEMLFRSPSSEEEQDSDVQSMTTAEAVVEQHNSLQDYMMDAAMAMEYEGLWDSLATEEEEKDENARARSKGKGKGKRRHSKKGGGKGKPGLSPQLVATLAAPTLV